MYCSLYCTGYQLEEVCVSGDKEQLPLSVRIPGVGMGLKRKVTRESHSDGVGPSTHCRLPGQVPDDEEEDGVHVTQADNRNTVRGLFKGNYEERRKFGVVDVFDTLGFAVSG